MGDGLGARRLRSLHHRSLGNHEGNFEEVSIMAEMTDWTDELTWPVLPGPEAEAA